MDKTQIDSLLKSGKQPGKYRPASMSLSGDAGKRIVVSAAKRVIKTHSEVIKALANR